MKQVFLTVLKKEWITTKRYPLNFISGLVSIYIIFLAIFMGFRYLGKNNPSYDQSVESLIVGFFLWTYALAAYARLSWGITEEANTGTLEQLYMSPIGFQWISVFIVISDFIISSLMEIPVLILMMLTTGKWLHIDLVTLILLFIPTIGGVYGVGFIVGGISLVYKRIRSFYQILQFLFIFLLMTPVERFPVAKFLPLSLGTYLIHENMTKGTSIFHMPVSDLGILYLNFLFYFFFGMWIFSKFEFYARKKGVLGHY